MSGISYHHSAIAVRLRHASTQHCLIYANGSITSSTEKSNGKGGSGEEGEKGLTTYCKRFNRQIESRTWLPPLEGLLCVRSTRVDSALRCGKRKKGGNKFIQEACVSISCLDSAV